MPAPKPHKILIVEDESLIGWSMANALGRAGYEPEVVDCGEDAVKKVTAGGYDLVISDFRLPRMDGLDLAARLKLVSHTLPVVMISSHEELGASEIDPSRGIDYVIEKPFNLNEIVALVGEILQAASSDLRKSEGSDN
jgi:DNA-binding response OmpR family regulator